MNDDVNPTVKILPSFSRRDQLRQNFDYYSKMYKGDNHHLPLDIFRIFLFSLFMSLIIALALSILGINNVSAETWSSFFVASSQIVTTLIGVGITISLIMVQINSHRLGYGFHSFFLRKIGLILVLIFSSLVVQLMTVLSLGEGNITFLVPFSFITIFFSILLIVYFFGYSAIKISGREYTRHISVKIVKSIKDGNCLDVEDNLDQLIGLLSNAVQNRESQLIKEIIENLYDVYLYGITNSKEVWSLIDSRNTYQGSLNHSTEFLYEEIARSLSTAFSELIDSKQYNSSKNIISAHSSLMSQISYNQFNGSNSLEELTQTIIKYSSKNDDLRRVILRRIKTFFEYSFYLNPPDFNMALYNALPYSLLRWVIENDRTFLSQIFKTIIDAPRRREDISEKIFLSMMDLLCSTYEESLIRKINDKVFRQSLSENIYTYYVILFKRKYVFKKEGLSRVKKILSKELTSKGILNKIKERESWGNFLGRKIKDILSEFDPSGNMSQWNFDEKKSLLLINKINASLGL